MCKFDNAKDLGSQRTGLSTADRASLSRLSGRVAEKRSVCLGLRLLVTAVTIFLSSSSMLPCMNRSASSMTKYDTDSRERSPMSCRPISFPGVAIMTSTPAWIKSDSRTCWLARAATADSFVKRRSTLILSVLQTYKKRCKQLNRYSQISVSSPLLIVPASGFIGIPPHTSSAEYLLETEDVLTGWGRGGTVGMTLSTNL